MSEPQIKKTDRDSKYLGQWFREKYTNSEIISIWKIGNKKQKQNVMPMEINDSTIVKMMLIECWHYSCFTLPLHYLNYQELKGELM